MPTNRKEHLRYRYGICLNDSCSKCKSKEVQQIAARKDLVCEECQKPLRECPPPKSFWDKFGKLIIGGAVAVVAVGAGCIFAFGTSDKEKIEKEEPIIEQPASEPATAVEEADTTTEPTDTVSTPIQEEEPAAEPAATTDSPAPRASIRVPFGTYSGPDNGLNGEIKVTRSYSLDLRNAAHETIELQPGDIITHTKFKNGELVSGYWHRGSESRSFHR